MKCRSLCTLSQFAEKFAALIIKLSRLTSFPRRENSFVGIGTSESNASTFSTWTHPRSLCLFIETHCLQCAAVIEFGSGCSRSHRRRTSLSNPRWRVNRIGRWRKVIRKTLLRRSRSVQRVSKFSAPRIFPPSRLYGTNAVRAFISAHIHKIRDFTSEGCRW